MRYESRLLIAVAIVALAAIVAIVYRARLRSKASAEGIDIAVEESRNQVPADGNMGGPGGDDGGSS